MSEVLYNDNYVESKPKKPSFETQKSRFSSEFKNNPSFQELHQKQLQESKELEKNNEIQKQNITNETHETLDKEALVSNAKNFLYESFGLKENLGENSSLENFLKGIIDEAILGNGELLIEIVNTKGQILIDAISKILTWEGLKNVAISLGESIWNLFDGDAYKRGKSVAELGLIGTGLGAGVALGKKGLKVGLKEIAKHGVNKENLVKSEGLKQVVKETNSSVEKIIPKKQFDPEKMLIEDIAKLGDQDRVLAGKLLLKRDLSEVEQKAILESHYVGDSRLEAGINNYNFAEKRQKYIILKNAGFQEEEIKTLMQKGVCGKESIYSIGNRLKPEQRKKLEEHGKELKEQEFYNKRLDLSEFEKLSIPEKLESLGIPKDFYDLLNVSGVLSPNFDIIERYKKLKYGDTFLKNKMPIDYEGMINNALSKYPNLTRSEAFLVFAYTDNFLFDNLNTRLRKSGYESLSSGEKKLVDSLNGILLKMPQLEGKFIVRGDSWKGWITPDQNLPKIPNLEISRLIDDGKSVGYKNGDTINLHSFTSVSNNLDDIFIGRNHPSKDTLVIINGERLKIRDISDLAMFTNFAESLGKNPTSFEGVILSDSKVIFRSSEIKDIKLKDSGNGEKYKQRVLQITVDGVK